MAEGDSNEQSFAADGGSDEDEPICGFQASPRKGGHVVVAIDIGTTYSGYAWSFSRSKHTINAMRAADPYRPEGSTMTTKVPTTLLLDPDKIFDSFGHAAMRKYNRELDENEQKEWYYLERFKMKLHTDQNLSRRTPVCAANGHELPIRTVFAHALRHFKEIALRECQALSEIRLDESEFEWVITVPAIWKGGAKQMMREAAYEAGLASEATPDKLGIALEPESASLYCKSVQLIVQTTVDEGLVARAFSSGTTYVLADLGGGTADVTVHQVTDGGVKELHHATGGAWGGTYVDKNFVQLLHNIFGEDVIEEYKAEFPGDWVELVSVKFETNKRTVSLNAATYIEFPFSFHSFLSDHGSSAKEAIAAMNNPNLKFTRGTLAIKYPEVRKLFQPVFENIADHLETIIRDVGKVEFMILVGGFATCELLQTYFRGRFEEPFNLRMIIPPLCSLAVVMGAVLFGHDPTEIESRRVRYSYGIEYLEEPEFDLSDLSSALEPSSDADPSDAFSRLFMTMTMLAGASRERLKFQTFVRRNQEVLIDEEVTHPFTPCRPNQEAAQIIVYESDKEKTEFISEEGVRKIAQMKLPLPNVDLGMNREILVSMKFGLTEIKVHSVDLSSGKRAEKSIYRILKSLEAPDKTKLQPYHGLFLYNPWPYELTVFDNPGVCVTQFFQAAPSFCVHSSSRVCFLDLCWRQNDFL